MDKNIETYVDNNFLECFKSTLAEYDLNATVVKELPEGNRWRIEFPSIHTAYLFGSSYSMKIMKEIAMRWYENSFSYRRQS